MEGYKHTKYTHLGMQILVWLTGGIRYSYVVQVKGVPRPSVDVGIEVNARTTLYSICYNCVSLVLLPSVPNVYCSPQ